MVPANDSASDQGFDVRVITSSLDLDDYDILATRMISVAVPYQTTESFRKLIWAAMVTYSFGNASVDHVMKRYGFLWEKRKDKSFQRDRRITALREIVEWIDSIATELDHADQADSLGRICSKAALCRLEASFKAAYSLVRKEYVFETDVVVRLILEQLAWAYVVHSTPDADVLKVKPTKCISALKAVFPECGPLYGTLTEWAHIDPSIAENYLNFQEFGTPVVRRSPFSSFESGANLAALAPIFLDVVQRLFSPFSRETYDVRRQQLLNLKAEYFAKLRDDQVLIKAGGTP